MSKLIKPRHLRNRIKAAITKVKPAYAGKKKKASKVKKAAAKRKTKKTTKKKKR